MFDAGFRRETRYDARGQPKAYAGPSQHVRAGYVKDVAMPTDGHSHDGDHARVCALQRCSPACRFPPLPSRRNATWNLNGTVISTLAPTGPRRRFRPRQRSSGVQPKQCDILGHQHHIALDILMRGPELQFFPLTTPTPSPLPVRIVNGNAASSEWEEHRLSGLTSAGMTADRFWRGQTIFPRLEKPDRWRQHKTRTSLLLSGWWS